MALQCGAHGSVQCSSEVQGTQVAFALSQAGVRGYFAQSASTTHNTHLPVLVLQVGALNFVAQPAFDTHGQVVSST
jgi:hypothetical protein